MSAVLEGDEWKYAAPSAGPLTRAQAQAVLDDQYARRKIDLETWRDRTALLSEPTFKSYKSLV